MSKLSNEEKREYKTALRAFNSIEERVSNSGTDGFGLCSTCTYFCYREYELGHRSFAYCQHHSSDQRLRLSDSYRVTKCNSYSERGGLSLDAMWLIARHISLDENKVVGFRLSEAEDHELYLLEED